MRGFLLGYSKMPPGPATDLSPLPLGKADADEIDPELLALPDPPRRERTWTLLILGLTALVSLVMAVALRRDAAYAFASAVPTDLAELRDVAPSSLGQGNRFVSGRGMLGAAGAIRFERPFAEDTFRLSPLAGRRDFWVLVRVPAGEENARYVPPSQFRGRLVRFDAGGLRNRGLASVIEDATGEAVPKDGWMLVDGEAPGSATWAVGLAALFVAFAVWNLGAIAKLVRRVR
jgi:hypothetical protein